MGTRNLTMIYNEGKYVLAKYCQWDGYPTGQGAEICKFLSRIRNIEKLEERLGDLQYITSEELEDAWAEVGQPRGDDRVSWYIGKKFSKVHPELCRDIGGGILQMIVDSDGVFKTKNDLEFAADSLFCEWAYVIDFDKGVFEIYKGFNQMPLNPEDRFYFLTEKSRELEYREMYFPVKLVKSFALDEMDFPSFEELKMLEQEQYDEEEEPE